MKKKASEQKNANLNVFITESYISEILIKIKDKVLCLKPVFFIFIWVFFYHGVVAVALVGIKVWRKIVEQREIWLSSTGQLPNRQGERWEVIRRP